MLEVLFIAIFVLTFFQDGVTGLARCSVDQLNFPGLQKGQTSFYNDGEVFNIVCNSRYQVSRANVNSEYLTCQNGTWRGYLPPCVAASCTTPPPELNHGVAETLSSAHSSVVKYVCEDKYTLEGSSRVQCLFGQWVGQLPKCEINVVHNDNCSVPVVRGDIKEKKTGSVYWNFFAFRYQNEIKYITVPQGTIISNGNSLTLFCQDEYVIKGTVLQSGTITCLRGKWSPIPECVKELPSKCYLRNLRNKSHVSAETPSVTLSGDKLPVICDDSYIPRPELPVCLTGEWINDFEPSCTASSCTIPSFKGEIKKENSTFFWNRKTFRYERPKELIKVAPDTIISNDISLQLFCPERYQIKETGVRSGKITCSQGSWSPKPECIEAGIPRVSIASPSRTTEVTVPPKTPFDIPSRAITETTTSMPTTISIITKASSAPSTTLVIPNLARTSLQTDVPEGECSCEYSVSDENLVAHADGKRLKFHEKVRKGVVVVFRCEQVGLYRFQGPQEMSCENCRTWSSSEFPKCAAPQRGDAVILFSKSYNISENGTLKIAGGKSIRLKCIAMETAAYPRWNMPNDIGVKIKTELKDREDFGDILYTSQLYIKNADYRNEGSYGCVVGNNPINILHVIVTDHDDLHCPKFPEKDDVIITYEMERRVVSKASFACLKPGHELTGKAVLTCLKNGEWSDPPPQCTTPLCSLDALFSKVPPNVEPNVEDVSGESVPYNSIVMMMCANDMTLTGNPMARCGKDGEWKINVECVHGCPPIKKSSGSPLMVKPEKVTYNFGDIISFSCPPGMRLNTDFELVVCLKSSWSETIIPECEIWE